MPARRAVAGRNLGQFAHSATDIGDARFALFDRGQFAANIREYRFRFARAIFVGEADFFGSRQRFVLRPTAKRVVGHFLKIRVHSGFHSAQPKPVLPLPLPQ